MSTDDQRRQRLAIVGAVGAPAPWVGAGSVHAAHHAFVGIERTGRFREIDVFVDEPARAARATPRDGARLRWHAKPSLVAATGRYWAVQIANGEQLDAAPHLLRPRADWAPVLCDVGTSHHDGQWWSFLTAALTGALRDTDGLLFKSERTRRLFQRTWARWRERFGALPEPTAGVLPNGVDVTANVRDAALGADARRQLGLAASDVVFLSWSRLSPASKGDPRALITLWSEVVARAPSAVLVLAGACPERLRGFPDELRAAARAARVADRVVVLPNPYDTWGRAKQALMSAADVFCHLSTGLEEGMSSAVLEAMAHGLPVLAADWAGIAEAVSDGSEGWLVDTIAGAVPDEVRASVMAREPWYVAVDAAQSIACDGQAVVERAVLAARDGSARAARGIAARRRVEADFTLDVVAARRIAWIDAVADEARRRWTGEPAPVRPLVELDDVLGALASRHLDAGTRVRLVDGAPGLAPVLDGAVAVALRAAAGPVTVAALAASLDPPLAPGHEGWPGLLRALTRAIAVHAVELADER